MGPPGKGQAHQSFLICLSHATSTPSLGSSLACPTLSQTQPVQFHLLAFAYAVIIPGKTFAQILHPNEGSEIKYHLPCEGFLGFPGDLTYLLHTPGPSCL